MAGQKDTLKRKVTQRSVDARRAPRRRNSSAAKGTPAPKHPTDNQRRYERSKARKEGREPAPWAAAKPRGRKRGPGHAAPVNGDASGGTAYEHLSGEELLDAIRREELTSKALENREREGGLAEMRVIEGRATETVQQTLAAFDTLGVELAEVVPAEVAGEVARRVAAKKGALADVLGGVWQ